MKKIKYHVKEKDKTYEIHYQPAPQFGDYDAISFIIVSNQRKKFTYLIKISGTLKAVLMGQAKVTPANYQEVIIKTFIEYVKSKLNEGYERDIEFLFKASQQNLFEKYLGMAGAMPRESSFEMQQWNVLKYLYDTHYELFNTDDTPVSLRILSQDLAIGKRRTLDILKSLKDDDKIELFDGRDIDKIFARITPKGIKAVESK